MSIYKSHYRGDPGLLGFLGKVGGALPGVGTAISAVSGVASLFGGKKRTAAPGRPSPAVNLASIATIPPILRGVGGAIGRGARSIPGQIGIGTGIGLGVERLLRGGGGKRYRRQNPCNPKALRRAIRRVQKFGDFARAVGFSRPPAKLKGVGFKKRRRR